MLVNLISRYLSATPDVMKKIAQLLLLALMLLSSCTKVETAPSSPNSIAISFSPVLETVMNSGGKSNATATTKVGSMALDTRASFFTYAWYLPNGKKWDTDKADAKPYIEKAEVSYYTNAVSSFVANSWHTSRLYYWPRGGCLTFLSYTCMSGETFYPNAVTPGSFSTCEIDKEKGLSIKPFPTEMNCGQDFDLLVADFVADRGIDFNGVPTLFEHKLAKISFYVKLDAPTTDTYALTGLKLTNICFQGDYSSGGYQGDSWSNYQSVNELLPTLPDIGYISIEQQKKQVGPDISVIPQHFNSFEYKYGTRNEPEVIINYTKNGVPQKVTKMLKDFEAKWTMGTHIKYNIIFRTDTADVGTTSITRTPSGSIDSTGFAAVTGTLASDSTDSSVVIMSTETSEWKPVTRYL